MGERRHHRRYHYGNCSRCTRLSSMAAMKTYRTQMCKQWLVHEDGVKAYQMQNEEFDFHYGLNRKNRRTVREDIPVAKVVQTEEERRQQQERYQYLQHLKSQAEEDERVAQRVKVELEVEEVQKQKQIETKDEQIAREMQEKEKKKYERYLEKKKEKNLQKQREKLEKELAQHTEDARLVLNADGATVRQLGSAVEDLSLSPRGTTPNGHARVTPSGHIEDDGDFSDFYTIPNDGSVNPVEHKIMQEHQDEELARLLQDQEHKRTKAEVDRRKLRQIEVQDEQLARVIQEQEKLKAKKLKQRRHQLREQQRQQQMAQEAMASGMDMSTAMEMADPSQLNGQPPGHRYRRDSYTRSISNSTPSQESLPHQALGRHTSSPPSLPPREPPSYETHKRIQEQNARVLQTLPTGEILGEDVGEVERWLAESSPHHVPSGHHRGQRLLNDRMAPSPSPPGSYHSDDDGSRSFSPDRSVGSGHAVSAPMQFNIAAAIDPTYKRRQQEIHQIDQTEVKAQIPISRSLPLSDGMDLEWDPSLRGSLRRPKGHWNAMTGNYTDSTGTTSTLGRMEEEPGPDGPVMSPWQPVQGQKRSTLDKTRKPKRQSQPPVTKKDSRGSCKQQ